MLPILALGALLVGAVVLSLFWEEIKTFLESAWDVIKDVAISSAVEGFLTFIKTSDYKLALSRAGVVAVQKFFSKLSFGEWVETEIHRTVSAEEIPNDLKEMVETAKGKMVDITKRVVKELDLKV